jgi:DNA-binding transcriptional ArsR family regulator
MPRSFPGIGSVRLEVSATYVGRMGTYGDADVARVAVLFGEPSRARMLMALGDGRSLPASVLAAEAGLSAPATSAHLAQLRDAGLVSVEPSGRHRYYRLAGPEVAAVLEAMAQIAPAQPVTSLRQGTRASALRFARTCYDHLAGRLGVEVTAGLLRLGALESTDGIASTARRSSDRLSAPLRKHPYRLGPAAGPVFADLGVSLDELSRGSRRPLLRFCMDWTEQCHHLAGRLGAAVCAAAVEEGWIERKPHQRGVRTTEAGAEAFKERLGVVA